MVSPSLVLSISGVLPMIISSSLANDIQRLALPSTTPPPLQAFGGFPQCAFITLRVRRRVSVEPLPGLSMACGSGH